MAEMGLKELDKRLKEWSEIVGSLFSQAEWLLSQNWPEPLLLLAPPGLGTSEGASLEEVYKAWKNVGLFLLTKAGSWEERELGYAPSYTEDMLLMGHEAVVKAALLLACPLAQPVFLYRFSNEKLATKLLLAARNVSGKILSIPKRARKKSEKGLKRGQGSFKPSISLSKCKPFPPSALLSIGPSPALVLWNRAAKNVNFAIEASKRDKADSTTIGEALQDCLEGEWRGIKTALVEAKWFLEPTSSPTSMPFPLPDLSLPFICPNWLVYSAALAYWRARLMLSCVFYIDIIYADIAQDLMSRIVWIWNKWMKPF